MFKVAVSARRIRIWALAAAVVLGALALGSIAVPLVQHSAALASATQLQDGTLAAADLGALSALPRGTQLEDSDRPPSAAARGVVAFGDGAAVSLTRFEDGTPAESRLELAGEALGLALSPAGDLLVVADSTGVLSLFDIAAPTAVEVGAVEVDLGGAPEVAIATSADGSFVAVAPVNGERIVLLSRDSGPVREVTGGLPVSGLASGPSSTVYALADDTILVLDAAAGAIVRSVAAPLSDVSGLALVDGGESLAVWSADRMLLLDASLLDTVASYDPVDPVFGVADGSSERTIMVGIGGPAPRAALVDLESGTTLSEIFIDAASEASSATPALGAGGAAGMLFVATADGAATGSWDASRVAWPVWWTSALVLALLATVCALLALSANALSARLHRNAVGSLRTRVVAHRAAPAVAAPVPGAVEPESAGAHPVPALTEQVGAAPLAGPDGRIQDRMAALGFSITASAEAQRVIEVVRSEADLDSDASAEITIDNVFDDEAIAGSLHESGARIATFVLWLSPDPDGGTRTTFRVDWYATARPTKLSIPVGSTDSIAYGPLRDFARRLGARLQEARP